MCFFIARPNPFCAQAIDTFGFASEIKMQQPFIYANIKGASSETVPERASMCRKKYSGWGLVHPQQIQLVLPG
jgi:hypothetical protein